MELEDVVVKGKDYAYGLTSHVIASGDGHGFKCKTKPTFSVSLSSPGTLAPCTGAPLAGQYRWDLPESRQLINLLGGEVTKHEVESLVGMVCPA